MPTLYGNIVNSRWRAYIDYTVTTNNATTYTIKATMGLYNVQPYTSYNADGVLAATSKTKYTAHSDDIGDDTGQKWPLISNKIYSWSKTHSVQSPNIACTLTTGGGSLANGTSSITQALSISAKTHYTVSFNANHGSGAPEAQTKWHGESLTLSTTKPTRTGYQFAGWNTNASGTGTNYAAGGTYSVNDGVTLYAKWTPNKVSIVYNANGGTVGGSYKMPYTVTYNYNNTINLYNISTFGLTRTGYHVNDGQEWNSKGDHTGTNYDHSTDYSWTTFGSTSSATKTVNVYANWKPNTYTLTFNANGGSITTTGGSVTTTSKQVNYNAAYGELPTPERQYYRFDGWFTAANGGSQVSSSTKMGTSNVTVYAHWTKLYVPPKISITTAKRANSSHQDDDDGTVPCVIFQWTQGQDSEEQPIIPSKYDIIFTNQDDPTNVYSVEGQDITTSPITVYLDAITVAAENAFDVEVILHQEGYADVSDTDYISQSYYIIDISDDGKGIAFGQPSTNNGFYCLMNTVFTGTVDKLADTGENFYTAKRTDYDVSVGLGVGLGGSNHGVYSYQVTANSTNGLTQNTPATWIVYRNKEGNIGLGGTLFSNLFVNETHTYKSNSLTIQGGYAQNGTLTVTKAGYRPVAISGWRGSNGDNGSGGSHINPFTLRLSASSAGSGTVQIGISAVNGDITNCSFWVDVLWIKDI